MLAKRVVGIVGLAAALVGTLCIPIAARAAGEQDMAAAGVRAMIAKTNELMKNNGSLKDFMKLFYEKDMMITGEGDIYYRNLKSFEKPLAAYMANQRNCRLFFTSPIRSSGDMATAFIQEHCGPATVGASAEDYRILYVFRRNTSGWHVIMEEFVKGAF
jgi:ketosteroid isomerase-like protein